MPTESDSTQHHVERNTSAGPGLEPAADEPGAFSGNGRWFIAAVVLVLVVYPAVRWILSRGGGPTPTQEAGTVDAGQAALQLSFQLLQAGQHEEAVAAAKAATAANPQSADAYNNLAVSYMGLHKLDEAIQAAQEAIHLRPDYKLAKNNLVWFQQEKTKAALPPVPVTQAAQAGALLNQSLQHAQAKRYRECMDMAMQATTLDPGSARAFNNAGFCAANLQLWDEAIRNVQEAIRLDPGLQLAKNNLAWMQQEKLKADAAKTK